MEIRIYNPEYKSEWDSFVRNSKNGTFLFYRDFMEYHSNRFIDHSFMFYSDKGLIGIMPGHLNDRIYYTHNGLTYGGLIMSKGITMTDVLSIFEHLTITLRNQGIIKIIYKAIPHIYHQQPAEEDLYALFRHKATLSERSISSSILISNKMDYSKIRKRGIKKAKDANLEIAESDDISTFWKILSSNLERKYNTKPVHSLNEISFLKKRFPNEIKLFSATDQNGEFLAGCLLFDMESIAHIQYIAGTTKGKQCGAIDLLIDYIINVICSDKIYFDYGTSTEDHGLYLNEKLIYQKEGFGARGIVYDIYTIDL